MGQGMAVADGAWLDFVQALGPTAVALLLAYLVYLWDRRSKREQFEREQKYSRKLSAYELVLGALRRFLGLLAWLNLSLWWEREGKKPIPGLSEAGAEEAREATRSFLLILGEYVLGARGGMTGAEASAVSGGIGDLRGFGGEDGRRVFLAMIGAMVEAERDFERGMAVLRLSSIPAEDADKLEGLLSGWRKRLVLVAENPAVPDTAALEAELREAEERMRQDLEATLRRS